MDSTTATTADLAPAFQFLLDHPTLPLSSGVTVYHPGDGNGGISVVLDTPAQVQEWADAMGVQAVHREHRDAVQHTAQVDGPVYVSVIAITATEVSA